MKRVRRLLYLHFNETGVSPTTLRRGGHAYVDFLHVYMVSRRFRTSARARRWAKQNTGEATLTTNCLNTKTGESWTSSNEIVRAPVRRISARKRKAILKRYGM